MKPTLRKSFLTVHTWVGLTAGIILLLVAVTGALLIFRPQLERRLDPQRFIVPTAGARLSIDDLVARARVAHPTGNLESVRFYGDPTMPLLVLFSTHEYVHMNPHTGAVLGTRSRYGEGYGWIEGVHKYLTVDPSRGETLNGSLAFVFAGLVLTGLVLWWPATRRALMAGITLNRQLSGRAWDLNLHKTIGAYAAVIVLFSAVTGIPIALDSTRAVIYALTFSGRQIPPAATSASAGQFAGFEAVARQIETVMPHAKETYIALPTGPLVTAYAIAADAPHPNARSYVWCDAETAKLIRYAPYAAAPRGFRIYYWLMSLHTGVAGGWLMRGLLLFGTLSVPVLTYTGLTSYLRRKKRRSAIAAIRPNPAGTTALETGTP